MLLEPGFCCWLGQQVSGGSGWLRSLMNFRDSSLFWIDEYGSNSLSECCSQSSSDLGTALSCHFRPEAIIFHHSLWSLKSLRSFEQEWGLFYIIPGQGCVVSTCVFRCESSQDRFIYAILSLKPFILI